MATIETTRVHIVYNFNICRVAGIQVSNFTGKVLKQFQKSYSETDQYRYGDGGTDKNKKRRKNEKEGWTVIINKLATCQIAHTVWF